MRSRNLKIMTAAISLWVLIAACALPTMLTGGDDTPALETIVQQTVEARQTQAGVETLIAQLTLVSGSSPEPYATQSPGVLPTTSGALPTSTAVPSLTPPSVPTAVPTNTAIPYSTWWPTATRIPPTPVPCYQLRFVSDITVPDNTVMSPNSSFVKTWRVRNSGSCSWGPDFQLVFVSGNSMSATTAIPINATVPPGAQVDLSVAMVAPSTTGTHQGNWMLRSASNVLFGYGARSDQAFWLKIDVVQTGSTSSRDFANNFCRATWRNNSGSLPCPGTANFTTGSVSYTNAPRFESGYQDDEPALILIPSNGGGGMISGSYPAVNVKAGDRFTALIGCLYESPNCSVTFELKYSADSGPIQSLGSWVEVSDGNFNRLNVDLSALAGKSVEFILSVNNNNGSSQDDRFFIMVPMVYR